MESMMKGDHRENGVGLEYWVRWQVPVCALIFTLPSFVALRLLLRRRRREQQTTLKSTDLWVPCWRNLNPLWLLFFRAFSFASMAYTLYYVVLFLGGAFAFYFYTQWTFALVTLYFALATIVSARGCWKYYWKKPVPPVDGESDGFLKRDSKSIVSSETKEIKGTAKFSSRYSREGSEADFLEHLVQALYQTSAGASMLTDIVFWCLLLPFLLGENFQLTLLIVNIHSVNAVFLVLDSALNSQPFAWFGLVYFVLWSASYVVFQWILHACGFTWWPYPFLELATPSAPLWYLALALVHLPCFGIYVLLVKAKDSIFSRIFPYAFVRTVNGTRKNPLAKKQI